MEYIFNPKFGSNEHLYYFTYTKGTRTTFICKKLIPVRIRPISLAVWCGTYVPRGKLGFSLADAKVSNPLTPKLHHNF
jgi:hypothetical protein